MVVTLEKFYKLTNLNGVYVPFFQRTFALTFEMRRDQLE